MSGRRKKSKKRVNEKGCDESEYKITCTADRKKRE